MGICMGTLIEMRRESVSCEAMALCKECGKSLKDFFLMNMNHHKVTSHVPGKCEVCGRRFTISRNMQDHKMRHHNIYFSRYLPTLAVPM